jgi:two-component system chemotaxis response regulator CheY
MRILVIDDDGDIRAILGMVLAAEGHEVETAIDGAAGLDRLRESPRPSLILLDMMMPRLDGEGFLRAMRSDPLTADIPVVILTGHPTARRTAAELGAAGYLVKPVELVDLLSAVHQAGRAPHAAP